MPRRLALPERQQATTALQEVKTCEQGVKPVSPALPPSPEIPSSRVVRRNEQKNEAAEEEAAEEAAATSSSAGEVGGAGASVVVPRTLAQVIN